jgi:hypothetical protein
VAAKKTIKMRPIHKEHKIVIDQSLKSLLEEILNYKEKYLRLIQETQYINSLKLLAIADYVGQEYTHGGDIRCMIENFKDFNFVRPADPQANAGQFENESWKKELDLFWKRRGIYIYIYGQQNETL